MSLDPKEIFDADWVGIYEKRMEALHLQMSEIRTTYFLYERIVKFPFHLFSRYHGAFWVLTRKSMFVAIIVGLWRLLYDNKPESLTVVKMKNEVMKRARSEEARKHISDFLRKANVKERLSTTRREIKRMRHEHFAHLDVANVDTPPEQKAQGITLTELSHVLDTAEKILNAIGLDTEYMFLPPDYHPRVRHPQGVDSRPDIERILDEMAQSCPDFHLPETKPYEFTFYWKHRNEAERKVFNAYRKKLDLSEIHDNG